VSPPALLLQQLRRAHSIFLLHHGPCLDEIHARLGRTRLRRILDHFWTRFARVWDVLLHGNPAVAVYRGIKLAAGGELGMGVGEEEWGSGERDVLEGFVQRTPGLIDMVVSRFGDTSPSSRSFPSPAPPAGTMSGRRGNKSPAAANAAAATGSAMPEQTPAGGGLGQEPAPADGVIFSGVGAISRTSTRAVAAWMEWLHMYGLRAYGVHDNPKSTARRKPKKRPPPRHQRTGQHAPAYAAAASPLRAKYDGEDDDATAATDGGSSSSLRKKAPPGLGAQRLGGTARPLSKSGADGNGASAKGDADAGAMVAAAGSPPPTAAASTSSTFMKYLTLGYGSTWLGAGTEKGHQSVHTGRQEKLAGTGSASRSAAAAAAGHLHGGGEKPARAGGAGRAVSSPRGAARFEGHFLIGLRGNLEEEEEEDESEADSVAEGVINNASNNNDNDDSQVRGDTGIEAGAEKPFSGGRIMLRTVNVDILPTEAAAAEDRSGDGRSPSVVQSLLQDPFLVRKAKNGDGKPTTLRVVVYQVSRVGAARPSFRSSPPHIRPPSHFALLSSQISTLPKKQKPGRKSHIKI
jgi:hypothetical protein